MRRKRPVKPHPASGGNRKGEFRFFLGASYVECGGIASGDTAFDFTEVPGNSKAAKNHTKSKRRRARVPSCRRGPYQTAPRASKSKKQDAPNWNWKGLAMRLKVWD
jgi:hypothetical protein